MSHDIEAAWATSEIAHLLKIRPELFFQKVFDGNEVSTVAGIDSRRNWPIADGIVQLDHPQSSTKYNIAVEYKRQNEGLHGILTALGQAHAYLHKGFSATSIVVPEKYSSHSSPGEHMRDIIALNSPDIPIAVLTYSDPDVQSESPFREKLRCLRQVQMDDYKPRTPSPIDIRISTQWGHMREGSSDSHVFFCYLKSAKECSSDTIEEDSYPVPECLRSVIDDDPIKYLSYTSGDTYHDLVWRNFWFTYVLTFEMMIPWTVDLDGYRVNHVLSGLRQAGGEFKKFFSGRSDSIKQKIVDRLNAGEISENHALKEFVKNVRNRAHSFREDVDSGLEALGMLETDGRPSALGYRYIDACERTGKFEQGAPGMILKSALLNNANYGAFLHYVYKVSERFFRRDPMRFADIPTAGSPTFCQYDYLSELAYVLASELNVMRTVSLRGGTSRKPFQAELAILRRLGFVSDFRVGLGLEINWPEVQNSLNFL